MYIHIPVLVFTVKVYPAHGSVLKALIIILTDYCSEVVGFLWITYYTNIPTTYTVVLRESDLPQ